MSDYPFYRRVYKLVPKNVLAKADGFKQSVKHKLPQELLKFNLNKYMNSYRIIMDKWADNEELNSLTDYFTEKQRVKCAFGKRSKTPYEYWKESKSLIRHKCMQKYGIINNLLLRETIYSDVRLCNNFRITVALSILHMFKPKRWLDMSAGWGDRLLAAILYGVDFYCGFDPNTSLHPCYSEMIDTFVLEGERGNFKLYATGFESNDEPVGETFDLVFSSPPFYNLETYSQSKGDSLVKFTTEQKWIDGFLLPSLIKAYNKLEKGGHLVLYYQGNAAQKKALHTLDKWMQYKGNIYFYDTTPREFYVWKKTRPTSHHIASLT